MDLTPNNHTSDNPNTKSPEEHDTETPPRIPTTAAKPLSFSNGILKRHNSLNHNYHNRHNHHPQVTYKECLKNHAATLGGHALDGCGEFMPSPAASLPADPTSIKCAACGCHRNFHRREPDEPIIPATHVIEYQPHHRHHPPPPPIPFSVAANRSPNSASPPPISSSYYPASAPHMLLALSAAGIQAPPESAAAPAGGAVTPGSSGRKRFRTKFTQEQKERMFHFAERVGWKMQKRDEDLVREFCNEVGVDRSVLKVWMHNNKNTFGKRDPSGVNNNDDVNNNEVGVNAHVVVGGEIHVGNDNGGAYNSGVNVGANGSSSSS